MILCSLISNLLSKIHMPFFEKNLQSTLLQPNSCCFQSQSQMKKPSVSSEPIIPHTKALKELPVVIP